MKSKIKTIVYQGKKYLEKSFKKVIPVSDYGRVIVKGSDLIKEANINVDFNVDNDKSYIMVKGYLNNKLIPGTDDPAKDSYGDIPTGDNVYDIDRLKSNPVALVNHENNASGIAGNYIYLSENEQGLQFKLILRDVASVHDLSTKDAVQAWGDGFGKAFSIGGRWLYDMENSNPDNNEYLLVKAILHEASLVAIGADQWALSNVPATVKKEGEGKDFKITLENSIRQYLKTKDNGLLTEIIKIKKENENG